MHPLPDWKTDGYVDGDKSDECRFWRLKVKKVEPFGYFGQVIATRGEGWWRLGTYAVWKKEATRTLKLHRPTSKVVTDLRTHLSRVSNSTARDFLTEAIECLEAGWLRAAVVLSWAGAISILHQEVIEKHLATFNKEATRRDAKWKAAKTADDLGLMGEDRFLDILQDLSVIGKNVKQELKESCLKLRNGYAHPNSLVPQENRAIVHLETLMTQVFAVFTK